MTSSGETTVFVYDASGKLVAEYSTQVESVENAKVAYLTSDHLGSPRVLTDKSAQVTSRRDFMPFGEEIVADQTHRKSTDEYGVADNVRQKFTGYERDGETGLDFAEARYYYNNHGRFTAVDPLFITKERLLDPQGINLYSYVRNNPLAYIDPTGLDFEFTGKDKNKFVTDVNNRDDAQFKVKLNRNGILEVVDNDKVDVSNLSNSEKAFFDAINDRENRAVLNGIGKDAGIDFGGFKGNGQNDIDSSDMALLRKADKNLAGNVIAHEMMEAYASAKSGSNDFDAMHSEASKRFPGAEMVDARALPGEENATMLSGATVDYSITRSRGATVFQVTYQFVKKEPVERDDLRLPLGHISKVKIIKKP